MQSHAVNGLSLTRVTKPDGNRKGVNRNEILFEVAQAPEGGYDARAVGYCIFTQGEDLDDLRNMAQDAVRCHFTGGCVPDAIRLHYLEDEATAL